MILDVIIITCLTLAVSLFAIATTSPATADTATVAVSYTPSYNTQYSLSVPTGLTLHSDGSPTTLTISVASWSDFPTNKSLYCDLSGSNTLTLAYIDIADPSQLRTALSGDPGASSKAKPSVIANGRPKVCAARPE